MRSCYLVFAMTCTLAAYGQDGHYWTQQYGTRSILLSNSVVGGVDDLAAVYYNPGRLPVITNAAFLLSANVYEYNSLAAKDAFGAAKNVSKSDIKGIPTLAAGTFKLKFLPKSHFAYAILTRQHSDMSFSYRDEVVQDVITGVPGNETFGSEASFSQKSYEQWVGVTWAQPLSEKISVGITTNYVTASQDKAGMINLQALAESGEVALYRYDRSFSYKTNGFLWKLGLAAAVGKWQLGLTTTTPQVNFTGKGSYRYEELLSSIPGMTVPDRYTTSYQKGLPMVYHTPWSFAFGASRKLGKHKLNFSTEWFSGLPSYTLMNAQDHVSQSDPTKVIGFHLIDQRQSVLNAGFGAEIFIDDHISAYGSFSTDFTSLPGTVSRFIERNDIVDSQTWNVDFYHVGGGVVLDFKGIDLTLGATHTGASATLPRVVNFPDSSNGSVFNSGTTSTLDWQRWRLIFSFSFPFLKDYAKKVSDKF